MAGSTEFYYNGFVMCMLVLIYIYIVQYLISKKVTEQVLKSRQFTSTLTRL